MREVPNKVWRDTLGVEEVAVLPLVDDHDGRSMPGWCTYENTVSEAPEVELISGGINTKTPQAVGLWRQGNLLHFGFEQSPAEMNDAGDAMLVNSIVYIARFTEDRPILIAPSPFAGTATRARSSLASWLSREDYPLELFESAIDPAVLATARDRSRDGYRAWFTETRPFLRPGPEGKLTWDAEAKTLGIAYDTPALFERGIEALRDADTRDAAAALLARYAPEGPAAADVDAWSAWYAANRPYLFYSEWGSYRWYVDPLARTRGVPTADLRGPVRADVTAAPAADARRGRSAP